MLTLNNIDPKLLRPNPRNPRRDVGDVEDLKASIPVVGILQPLVVIPDPDQDESDEPNGYLIEIGHRRHRAALELDMDAVPCIVAGDQGAAMQIARMLTENDHRSQLAPSERADAYAQLSLLDWDDERIAAFSGRPVEHVRAAIALTKLPEAARTAVDKGELGIDDSALLMEFTDDPKTMARVLKRGVGGWGLKHAIADERHKRQVRDATELFKAQLLVDRVKVIPAPKGWPYTESTVTEARDLVDKDGKRLDPEQVKTKPGFAAIVSRDFIEGKPKATIVCTDPEAWGYRPAPGTRAHDRAERDATEAAQAEHREALATAATVRHDFLAQTYSAAKNVKTLYLRALRTAVAEPGLLVFEDQFTTLASKVAGITFSQDIVVGAGVDRLTRMLVARWVCGAETNLQRCASGRSWQARAQAGVAYLDVLVEAGYVLSDAETTLYAELLREPTEDDDEADYDETDETEDNDENPTSGLIPDEQEAHEQHGVRLDNNGQDNLDDDVPDVDGRAADEEAHELVSA